MAKKKNIRIACTIWKGPSISPVKTFDTGDIVIIKMIKAMDAIDKKVNIIKNRLP